MRLSVALLFCLACLAAPLRADPPAVAAAGALPTVSLIDGWRQPDGGRVAGIVITLEPGWHTYWRVPGEAGIPPSFDWSASRNVAAVRYEWPRPDILDSYGMRSYGYVDALVLPVLLTPKDPAAPMDVALSLSFGICKDVCMQADRAVAARLGPEVGPGAAGGRRQIEAALAERAHSAAEAGIARVTCGVRPAEGGYEITAEVTFDRAPATAQVAVFESAQPGLWIGEAESETEGRTVVARAPLAGAGSAGPVLERRGLRVTMLDDRRAVDIRGCAAPE